MMRKVIFAIFLLAGMASQAQAQKEGQFWIGGSLGIQTSDEITPFPNTDENSFRKTYQYSIYPELGYAFSDRWAVGVSLGFGLLKSVDGLERRYKNFNVAPFVRYTYLNWKKISVFVDGGVGYAHSENDYIYENSSDHHTSNSYNYSIYLQPGFSLQLSSLIALTGQVGLFDVTYGKNGTEQSGTDSKQFSASLNSPFNISNTTIGVNFCF